ncbi:MAG: DSD1 family PLP-dependent enzyme [Burkholderiaceae bacterium]|nr:DSD1 family PLP-dependent enzyme [Burkholderiaceae bacterium]
MDLYQIDTPSLIIDEKKMQRNIDRMADKAKTLGLTLRPHLKTSKCWEVAKRQLWTPQGPATVSTLKEAEEFAKHGVTDMIYAVGIAPQKLPRVQQLLDAGVDLKLILDNVDSAKIVSDYCREHGSEIKILIEIDCDGHRSGLQPNDPAIVEVARALTDGAKLVGVLTHAGGSYDVNTPEALLERSRGERDGILKAAKQLRDAGFELEIVSVGSTPTALSADDFSGITEMRAGVYVFFDLFQAGVGVCSVDDIAISLLVTVIGHQEQKGWVITDGGWMALSRDRGTANQTTDQGYGLVCDVNGKLMPELWVCGANQEHGILARRDGGLLKREDFPIGMRLRILPNHACPIGAQHPQYYVVEDGVEIKAVWDRFYGW